MLWRVVKYLVTVQPESPGSLYLDENGDRVPKQLAAEFNSYTEAKEFAKKHGIIVDGVLHSVVVK